MEFSPALLNICLIAMATATAINLCVNKSAVASYEKETPGDPEMPPAPHSIVKTADRRASNVKVTYCNDRYFGKPCHTDTVDTGSCGSFGQFSRLEIYEFRHFTKQSCCTETLSSTFANFVSSASTSDGYYCDFYKYVVYMGIPSIG